MSGSTPHQSAIRMNALEPHENDEGPEPKRPESRQVRRTCAWLISERPFVDAYQEIASQMATPEIVGEEAHVVSGGLRRVPVGVGVLEVRIPLDEPGLGALLCLFQCLVVRLGVGLPVR